ncbi:lactonase family protein [Kineothrix sp. MB12-C1]|uniref:lactonase family protein n=1 Tax=Kineothrix sp. MB12-C1 TaxID=3070215 RepID=UPI0027D1F1B4|nr:lactonase family protein [Kineothrix sp. MB12-C1]WMC92495.1 lactonase family protein [Kineothrix sp. MB12-C1]
MGNEKYVAYVSTYTTGVGDKRGIKIYDVDVKKGRMTEKNHVEITNSSYITISHNQKYLYSITDFGVEAYEILENGDLKMINFASINGMRGCYLSTDYHDEYLFVAGYHDGKITVLRLTDNGAISHITDEIFHKGLGSMAERHSRPHVNCVKMTRDNRYLCAADLGMDHVKVYSVDREKGTLKLADVIRSEQESAPRHLKFSKDGRFLYIVHELKNYIDVYKYENKNNNPEFEKIQNISTLNEYHSSNAAASALNFSFDFNYLLSSNSGDNSVIIYRIDQETGMLTKLFCLPVSGDYPKDASLFPDNKHLVSLNHESNSMTFFNVDTQKGLLVMNGPEVKVEQPNCIIFHKLTNVKN